MARMLELFEMDEIQDVIGVSDEEVAARVRLSTQTFRRAKRGQAPEETIRAFYGALDSLRLERIDRLQNLKFKAAR